MCDANYTLIGINTGEYESQNDDDIMCYSEFRELLVQNRLEPKTEVIIGTNIEFPYHFIDDGAFPLGNNIMGPYPGILLVQDKKGAYC